jgi:hypothetical protein
MRRAHGVSFIAGLDRGVQAGMTDTRTLARGGAADS